MKGLRWFAHDDIPIDILSRLTAKTLHLLKTVSKDWLNLISDRSFISLQLKRAEPAPVSGFFFQEVYEWVADDDGESLRYIPADVERVTVRRDVLDFLTDYVVILSLNHGLLCCRSCFPCSQPMIYVCNPLNKQWRSLMWPDLPLDSSVALAFDPFQDPIDLSTDFKLVALSIIEDEGDEEELEDKFSLFFDIYSSKTRCWRRLKESIRCNSYLIKNRGVFANGLLYWLIDSVVLMFDHQNEMSWWISSPLPPSELTIIPQMCIGESQGKLHYVLISEHGLQLWALEDQFLPTWDLKFASSLDELERENPKVLYLIEEKVRDEFTPPWLEPLSFKDEALLLRIATTLYLYQFDTRTMKKLCDVSSLGPKSMHNPIVVPYTMSLVPVEQSIDE